jgi:hypothetical protein
MLGTPLKGFDDDGCALGTMLDGEEVGVEQDGRLELGVLVDGLNEEGKTLGAVLLG